MLSTVTLRPRWLASAVNILRWLTSAINVFLGSHNATTSGEPNDRHQASGSSQVPKRLASVDDATRGSPMPLLPGSSMVTMRRKCIDIPRSWPNAAADGQHNDLLDAVATLSQHHLIHLSMLRKCINVSWADPMPRRSGVPMRANAPASSPNAAQIGLLSGQSLRLCLSLSPALILDIDIDRQEHKDRPRIDFVRS
ncbi:hypothetical protein K523DRAFT_363447 [Schizophyllum commune Tattone D]|nr:hypothetical protein K523DRAFT_363447 [Schizophyllum commune Tattone D]